MYKQPNRKTCKNLNIYEKDSPILKIKKYLLQVNGRFVVLVLVCFLSYLIYLILFEKQREISHLVVHSPNDYNSCD